MEHKRKLQLAAVPILLLLAQSIKANQQIMQNVLDGSTIKQFVTPLPRPPRADGTKKLKATAVEFQQRILPDYFYDALPSSVEYTSVQTGKPVAEINPKKGTYLWGFKMSDGEKTVGPTVPGPTIIAKRGTPTVVEYVNDLVPFTDKKGRTLPGPLLQKFLTIDLSFMWGNPLNYPNFIDCMDFYSATALPFGNPGFYAGPQPLVIHLHGSETPSAYDGGPLSWFTPDNKYKGPAFVSNTYTYPNTMPATTLWYHNHVLGETRVQVGTAGVVGFYLIRGQPETSVPHGLPKGPYEIEMALTDRQFDTNGQIFWPDGNPCGTGLNGDPGNPTLHPYAIPEFFGDVICVNGKSWPYLEVEPRRYRFRILDASNARMYSLFLSDEKGRTNVTLPAIWQIGSDGGLFEYPVQVTGPEGFVPFAWYPFGNVPPLATNPPYNTVDPNYGIPVFTQQRLFISTAERMDIIIDFAGFEGKTLILNNDSPAPFPGDGTAFDPNVEGHVMQFRVNKPLRGKDTSYNPATDGKLRRGKANQFYPLTNGKGQPAPGVKVNLTRSLVLVEQEDPNTGSPVTVLINNTHFNGLNPFNNEPIADSVPYVNGTVWMTELPQIGSTEIWEIINLTPDAHPMHIHLIQFQVLSRQIFNIGPLVPPYFPESAVFPSYRTGTPESYEQQWPKHNKPPFPTGPGTLYGDGPPHPYLSNPGLVVGGNPDVTPWLLPATGLPEPWTNLTLIPPDPNEAYLKDTIKAFPGTVTRILVRWSPQLPVNGVKAGQNKFAFDPTTPLGKKDRFGYPGGPGYVWHCHILDHEDNDFMRPFFVRKKAQKQ